MGVTTFDTLKFAKRLREAGIPESQAEALAGAFETNLQELATKADLREMEFKINSQLILLRWMIGLMLAGVVSLILKAFFIP